MTEEERQRLSVRTIRVTLSAALRYASPNQTLLCKLRAQELLAHVRSKTTVAPVIAEIEALQAELDGGDLGEQLGDS